MDQLEVNVDRKQTMPTAEEQPNLRFGHTFSDHMLKVAWTSGSGWGTPQITPFGNISLSPAAPALHYAVEVGSVLCACTLYMLTAIRLCPFMLCCNCSRFLDVK